MTRAVLRRLASGSVVLATAFGLAGCSSAEPDLAADVADDLRAAVVEVAEASAQGRWDAAEDGVARVRALLEEAAADGDISVARYASVIAALERTEEELAAAQASDASTDATRDTADPTGSEGDTTAEETAVEAPTVDGPADGSTSRGAATGGEAGAPAGKPGKEAPGRESAPGQEKGRGKG